MIGIKDRSGWYLFLVMALMPIFFWLSAQTPSSRFIDWQTTLTSIGQILGLVGMAMFSLNLVLAARLKFLEPYFGGLNRIYLNHHTFGATAFILLLFHPLLLVMKYIPLSLRAAAEFFLPGNDLATTLAFFALLLMMIVLGITFYVDLAYQNWKFTHKFMGLAFFLASLHVFFIPSDVSRHIPLRVYMFSLVALGSACIIYRTLFSWLLVRRYPYRVKAVRGVNPLVREIELAAAGKALEHHPGQFIFISFLQPGLSREFHPFTISSSPAENGLRLTVKQLGDFTGRLGALTAGAGARIEGPFGKFSFLEVEQKQQIWIAGGIGITPFLSMARSLKNHAGYSIDLFYSVKTAAEAVFIDELNEIAARNPDFRVILYRTEALGHLSVEKIAEVCEIGNKDIFVCGPPAMMKGIKAQFKKLKIPASRIHSEEFALL